MFTRGSLGGFSSKLCLALFGFLLEMRMQGLCGQRALFFGNFPGSTAIQIEARAGGLQRFQITHGFGVDGQRTAQELAVDLGLHGDQLLVDADGQRLAFADNREFLLKLLEYTAGGLGWQSG